MKIALIGPGRRPIPPTDYGAIEILMWNYKNQLEKMGHTVDIYNTIWIHEVIYEINSKSYDFIHLHFDLYAAFCTKYLKQPYCLTSHCGGFSKFIPGKYDFYPAFNYLYQDSLEAPGNIVLAPEIEQLYVESGYKKFLKTLRNPVEVEKFHFSEKGNNKAVCIGTIVPRKKQAFLSDIAEGKVLIDFIGPHEKEYEPNFKENKTCKYLGSWHKTQIYEHLTDYSTLVLLSNSEADPLVVKEALAAGLSIVVSEAASYNLTNEDFITVIPYSMKDPNIITQTIQLSIDKNEERRRKIRAYAVARFGYDVLTKQYEEIMKDFKSYYGY